MVSVTCRPRRQFDRAHWFTSGPKNVSRLTSIPQRVRIVDLQKRAKFSADVINGRARKFSSPTLWISGSVVRAWIDVPDPPSRKSLELELIDVRHLDRFHPGKRKDVCQERLQIKDRVLHSYGSYSWIIIVPTQQPGKWTRRSWVEFSRFQESQGSRIPSSRPRVCRSCL